jgi:hypothetical protein
MLTRLEVDLHLKCINYTVRRYSISAINISVLCNDQRYIVNRVVHGLYNVDTHARTIGLLQLTIHHMTCQIGKREGITCPIQSQFNLCCAQSLVLLRSDNMKS